MIEKLREVAASVVEGGPSGAFLSLLRGIDDVEALRRVAGEFTPHVEVSVPIYNRLLELKPDDVVAIVDLGFIHWSINEEDEAQRCLRQARRLSSSREPYATTLEAALEKDEGRRRELYREILRQDPENEVARRNLETPRGSGRKQ